MQYTSMASEFDCSLRSLEGFPSFQVRNVVAICTTGVYVCMLSGRASNSFVESLQVCYHTSPCVLSFRPMLFVSSVLIFFASDVS